MTTSGFVMIVGTILLGVVGLLVVVLVGMFALAKLGDAAAGLPRVRASLIARGVDRRLVDRILVELETARRGIGLGLTALVGGGLGLAYGVSELNRMWAPVAGEYALYAGLPVLALGIGVALLARARRVDPDASSTHRALVTRGAHATALVPTMISLNLNVTTTADALASTRVTQWRPVPHVVVIFDDGTELMVRSFHDDDALAHELVRCLSAHLPNARPQPFVPAWRPSAGGGR